MTNSNNYNYYMPTRVIMGKDCIIQNSDVFKTLGKKALIVTGAQSAKKNGSQKDVITALESVNIPYQIFDRVMSNPTISIAYEGATLAVDNEIDFIIAIGGGSPMDAGKAISLLTAQYVSAENLFSGHYENKILPMALVPTTAGTGSEVTQYSILTNDNAQTKTSISSDLLFPTVALLDAKYTENLPVITTINTAVDALSHAVEGMLSVRASSISNTLASESIRMIMGCIPDMLQALQKRDKACLNFEKREQLLQASYMAGMVIAQAGTTVVHSMGYSLTYFKNIDHGRANGLLLGEYLRLVVKTQPMLIGIILKTMNLSSVDSFQALMLNLLGRKEELSSEEISQYSKLALQSKNVANGIVSPTEENIREMYERSLVN